MRRWQEAFSYYRAMVEDPKRWFVKRLNGGEFVITDNFRVYHARKEFFKTAPEQERVVSTFWSTGFSLLRREIS